MINVKEYEIDNKLYNVLLNRLKNKKLADLISKFFIRIILIIYSLFFRFTYVFNKKNNDKIQMNRVMKIKAKVKDENITTVDITFIIPVYNTEKYLENCINSIIENEWKYSYEIILIDDGSTDSSKKIIKKYIDNNKIKCFFQENKGAAIARNKGIDEARGKYLIFVDSDDQILSKGLENMVDIAEINNCDFVQGSYIKCGKYEEKVIFENELLSFNKNERKILMTIPGFPWGKVIKRELFKNIRFPNNFLYEDTIMPYLIYLRCNNIGSTSSLVYKYNLNDEGVTIKSKKTEKSEDTIKILEYILSYMNELNLNFDYELYRYTIACQLSYITYNRIKYNSKKFQKKIFEEICEFYKKLDFKLLESEGFIIKNIETSFNYNNFALWKMTSIVLNFLR